MALRNTKWEIPLLLIVVFSAFGGFIPEKALELMDYTVGESMMLVIPLGLATSYMLSQRQMKKMSNIETASFIIPILVVFAYHASSTAQDFFVSFNPYFGVLMVLMVAWAFYALTNEDI